MSASIRLFQNLSTGDTALVYIAIVVIPVLIWALVGLGPYSGFNTPPDYGDFEAQRHWMEITQHLYPKEWYYYDFSWWRLDYPPLTAYHSWLCGIIGNKINPEWFALDDSRGMENTGLKSYMRLTVIISQLVCYMPAIYFWLRSTRPQHSNNLTSSEIFLGLMIWPALTIIDHGHFQFNSVMLGLAAASLTFLVNRRFVWASIFFMLSLFFKQMSLYYAPVIFMAILSHCLGPPVHWEFKFWRLVSVGLAVIGTAGVLLWPFIDVNALEQPTLLQIVERVFPMFRGLWEDKVANFWCTLNYTAFKLKSRFTPGQLQALALGSTLMGIIPSCVAAFVGKPRVWPWAFSSCAWTFFLFSFQVHEKSVLIPLLPSLLATTMHRDIPNVANMSSWISNIAYLSLWPLIKREGLQLQFFVLIISSNWLLYNHRTFWPKSLFKKLVVASSYTGMLCVLAADTLDLVPSHIISRYPDLLVVLNMAGSFVCFLYYYLWSTWIMLTLTTE